MNDPSLVDVTDLDFAYRQGDDWLQVLYKVSFSIARGEAFGLVGESGCGKSTAAYQLMGIVATTFAFRMAPFFFRAPILRPAIAPNSIGSEATASASSRKTQQRR